MSRYLKWTVLEVGAGILLTGIVGTLILGCLTGFVSGETIGFMVGIVAAIALFYSMSVSVETAVETGDKVAAKRHSKRSYLLRLLAVSVGTLVAVELNWFNVVAALLALFSIKVGVFFQPITHKLFTRWFHLKEELSPEALYLPEEEKEAEDEDEDDDEDKPDRIDRFLERIYGKRYR